MRRRLTDRGRSMDWEQATALASPHVVKIETPTGYGTGFLAFYNSDRTWCGIATAAHVVSHADDWQQPIRIRHEFSQNPVFLTSKDRVVFIDPQTDSAVILFLKGDLQLPEIPIALLPVDAPLSVGVTVGWLGFPVIQQSTLCFFSGSVSARLDPGKAYLIDGVAINGVSGGPVIHCHNSDTIQFVGAISAYHANRATGETLPGLLVASDLSHFLDVAMSVRSIDEANRRKREFESTQRPDAQAQGSPADEADPNPAE
ncbi:MAG: serine protease [Proteobacteria bacterium]|nr:MAG: serine protease [Pseudomonadota bacterium]